MQEAEAPQGVKSNWRVRRWKPKVRASELSVRQLWILGRCYKHCVQNKCRQYGRIRKLDVYGEGILPWELEELSGLLDFKSSGRSLLLPFQLMEQPFLEELTKLPVPLEKTFSGEEAVKVAFGHGKPIGSTWRKWEPKIELKQLTQRQKEVLALCFLNAQQLPSPRIGRISSSKVKQEGVSKEEIDEIAKLLDFKKYDKRWTLPLQLLRNQVVREMARSWLIKNGRRNQGEYI